LEGFLNKEHATVLDCKKSKKVSLHGLGN